MAVPIEQTIRAEASRLALTSVVSSLMEQLGDALTGVIADVSDAAEVHAWAEGSRVPDALTERRLRDAFLVTQIMLQAESPETVRAWFVGMNPTLGDEAPALVIAEDPKAVVEAAYTFLANGW
jgi:hypothetical protein